MLAAVLRLKLSVPMPQPTTNTLAGINAYGTSTQACSAICAACKPADFRFARLGQLAVNPAGCRFHPTSSIGSD